MVLDQNAMSEPTTTKRITVSVANIFIDHFGFCRIDLDSSRNDTLDLVNAEEIVEAAYHVCQGKSFPILTDARNVDGIVTPGAREHIRSAPKMLKIRKAEAFIVNSLANRLIANLYIRVNRPPNPSKVFNTESEAVEWLREHL